MKSVRALLLLPGMALLAGCSGTSTRSPDVSTGVRASLSKAGLSTVNVSDDRDKGVVTLYGSVQAAGDKDQAEAIAKSLAGSQVVANQIAVLPPGGAGDAKKMDADLDKGIESNLDAALIGQKLHDQVRHSVRNSVVTLTGNVTSDIERAAAQETAAKVPNVRQVVNELQIQQHKATSSN